MFSITLSASALRSAYAVLGALIANRTTLPVLSQIRIERSENRLLLSATDLDRWLTFTCLAEPDPITPLAKKLASLRWPRDGGELLVPKLAVRDALRAADKDGSVTFAVEAPGAEDGELAAAVRISYSLNGSTVSTVVSTPLPADFPPLPEFAEDRVCTLDANGRASVIEAGQFSSTDDTRYVLNGVYLETQFADQPCTPAVIATDGRRLYRRAVPSLEALKANCILPTGMVELLGHASLLAQDWQIAVGRNVEHFRVVAGPWTLLGKLVEGNFPNYRQVIPSESSATARVGPASHRLLLNILGKLPTPPDKSNGSIVLRFNTDRLGVECPHTKATVVVPGINCPRSKVITLNRHFLRDLLATGPGTFHLIDSLSPLRYETSRRAVHVLMPMRTV